MKISFKTSATALLWLCVSACLHRDDVFNTDRSVAGLSVSLGMDISVASANERNMSVNTDDFIIDVCNSDGSLFTTFERFADLPDTIRLDPGRYFVKARSGRIYPGGFEMPYYDGQSDTVELNPEEVRNVAVMCSLGNCKVSVMYSQRLITDFTDYYTVVSNADTSITFTKSEDRNAYMELKPITVTARLSFIKSDGTKGEKILSGTIDEPERQRHYAIHLDAGLSEPAALVSLSVDESLLTRIVNITDQTASMPGNEIGYGALIITEIMYDPSALSDTQGEWFEIFNTSADTIDLFHLVLKRGTTNRHVIADHIFLEPDGYYILAKDDTACGVSGKYIYGGSISLPNTGDDLGIYNYGTDGTDGNIISGLNYGLSGYPTATGASICLDPGHFQADEAMNGSNWCVSVSLFDTGDKGTPGRINDPCF